MKIKDVIGSFLDDCIAVDVEMSQEEKLDIRDQIDKWLEIKGNFSSIQGILRAEAESNFGDRRTLFISNYSFMLFVKD